MSIVHDDIENLGRQIDKMRNKDDSETVRVSNAIGKVLGIVAEFVSGVFVGGAMGYLSDSIFGTNPSLLIFMLFCGAAAGFLNIYHYLKQNEKET